MKRIMEFIVDKRWLFLVLTVIIFGLSLFWVGNVVVSNDISKYLPPDSETLEGLSILEDEFGEVSSVKIVFEDLTLTEETEILAELLAIEDVVRVGYDTSASYHIDNHTLFIVYVGQESTSQEASDVLDYITTTYPEAMIGGDIFAANQPIIPNYVIIIAFIILMIILYTFSTSWVEPLVFLVTIGIAIVINMGTNIMFGSISNITASIAALLQLCLSIDYSIILLNRYRQEKKNSEVTATQAMKKALVDAFPSIAGSSLTTIVGLLCLLFMSFEVGTDLGMVLAKGVLLSTLTVFFVLPTFILVFDRWMEHTKKPALHISVKRLSHFSFKARKVIPVLFILLFIGGFFLRNSAVIGYIVPPSSADETLTLFEDDNTIVLLYHNDDEPVLGSIIMDLMSEEETISVTAYANTLGVELNATQLAQLSGFSEPEISGILTMAGTPTMTLYEFLSFVETNLAGSLTPEQLMAITMNKAIIEANISQMVGEDYSRLILTTTFDKESEESIAFIQQWTTSLDQQLTQDYYLLGDTPMASEIAGNFTSEFLLITILTVLSIFIVVAVTFKSLVIPTVLVAIIQTAIFITMGALGVSGQSIYFLAVLIVQAILMGATIDYGILFTSYLKQEDSSMKIEDALEDAYEGSIHSILTSASILFLVTAVIGLVSPDPTISQVLRALAVGTLSSTLLILFVLPSILIVIDRFVRHTNKLMNTMKKN